MKGLKKIMSNDNNYTPYYKIIKKSEAVEKKGFLTFFAIDERTVSIVCEFNHEYPLNTRKVIGPINIDDWTKFIEKTVKKKLAAPPVEIDSEHRELIQGNLDQEYDNIVDMVLAIKNKNNNNHDQNTTTAISRNKTSEYTIYRMVYDTSGKIYKSSKRSIRFNS